MDFFKGIKKQHDVMLSSRHPIERDLLVYVWCVVVVVVVFNHSLCMTLAAARNLGGEVVESTARRNSNVRYGTQRSQSNNSTYAGKEYEMFGG